MIALDRWVEYALACDSRPAALRLRRPQMIEALRHISSTMARWEAQTALLEEAQRLDCGMAPARRWCFSLYGIPLRMIGP